MTPLPPYQPDESLDVDAELEEILRKIASYAGMGMLDREDYEEAIANIKILFKALAVREMKQEGIL